MAAEERSPAQVPEELIFGEALQNWKWLLGLGIVFVILGIIGLGMTFALTIASVVLFGILFIVGSAVQFVDAFKVGGWKSTVFHVLIGILYLIAGIFMIVNPFKGAFVLTLVLAVSLVVVGIFRIFIAIQMRESANWFWPLLGGIISVALGVLIFAGWPVSGLWVIGLFIAIELLVHGWSYIFIALAARSAASRSAGRAEATA